MGRIFIGLAIAFGLQPSALLSQVQREHSQHQLPVARGQVIADGSIAPDQIPDELALKHLFIHLATAGTSTYYDVATKARRIGLSDVDMQALSRGVNRFRNTFTQLQARLVALKPTTPTDQPRLQPSRQM